jgi:predicted carbohydrate-binding protein with CBM5 and CBM33 domain
MSILRTNKIETTTAKPILNSTGSVINVYHSYDTTQAYYAQTSDVNLNGLSILLTPTSANSKFILQAVIPVTTNYVLGFGFKRNGVRISKATVNIQANMGVNLANIWFIAHTNNNYLFEQPILDVDTPNTTSSITYTPFFVNSWGGGAYGAYYNQRANNDMGSSSSFTIFEVVG